MTISRSALTLLLLTATAQTATAQRTPVAWGRWRPAELESSTAPTSRDTAGTRLPGDPAGLMLGGLVGGAAGLFGGGVLGYRLSGGDRLCGDDSCGLPGAILGAAAGEVFLLPLGVHLANHRRGNYGLALLASVAIGALGTSLASARDSGEILLAVPVVQLISAVMIERETSRPEAAVP